MPQFLQHVCTVFMIFSEFNPQCYFPREGCFAPWKKGLNTWNSRAIWLPFWNGQSTPAEKQTRSTASTEQQNHSKTSISLSLDTKSYVSVWWFSAMRSIGIALTSLWMKTFLVISGGLLEHVHLHYCEITVMNLCLCWYLFPENCHHVCCLTQN